MAEQGRGGRYVVRQQRGTLAPELLVADDLLAREPRRVLQASDRTTVVAVTLGGRELVVKRYQDRTVARALETLALGSRAARLWRGASRLAAAGFATPEVMAVLERCSLGIPLVSCAVTAFVPGPPLDALWRERAGTARRRLLVAFADWLRRLHAAGLYPQDLRAANVLVPSESPPTFVLVDLDRVRRYRRLSWRRRRKNLAQVYRSVGRGASLGEKARFLRAYLGPGAPAELRARGAGIERLGRRKDAEYARRRAIAAVAARRSG
ncbi:MAG TPA: lipopolysaccharide kinase InaA family protein [Candidatus Binatia bacterium]